MAQFGFAIYSVFCFGLFVYFSFVYSIFSAVENVTEVMLWMMFGYGLYLLLYLPALIIYLGRLHRRKSWAFLAIIPLFSLIFASYLTSDVSKGNPVGKIAESFTDHDPGRVMRYGSFQDRRSDRFK